MEVRVLRWTDLNVVKLAEHRLTREEVEELVNLDAWVPYTHEDYPEQVRIVGPTASGRMITVVLAPTANPAAWRPVTGWDAAADERRYYSEEWP